MSRNESDDGAFILHHPLVQFSIRCTSNHGFDQVGRWGGPGDISIWSKQLATFHPICQWASGKDKLNAPKTAKDISKDDTVNEVFNQVSQSVSDKPLMQRAYPAESHEAEREEAGTIDFADEDESGDVPAVASDVKKLEKAFDEEKEMLEQLPLPGTTAEEP